MKTDKTLQRELRKYVGKWVAVCGKKVVAADKNPGNVMDIAKELCGNKETTIFRVHEKNQILLL